MIKIVKISFILAWVSCAVLLQAQETPDIYLRANFTEDSVLLRFYPTDAEAWEANLEQGYIVERYEITRDSFATAYELSQIEVDPSQALRKRYPAKGAFLPADSTWFIERKYEGMGYVTVMQKMLHDTVFDIAADGGSNRVEKHQYAAFGMEYYPEMMSEGLGLGLIDRDIDTMKVYKYVVSLASDPNVKNELTVYYTSNDRTFRNSETYSPPVRDVPFWAGVQKPITSYKIEGVAKPFGDSLVLRWGVMSPTAMLLSGKMGYRIYKQKKTYLGERLVEGSDIPVPTYATTYVDTFSVFPWDSTRVDIYVANNPSLDSLAMVAAQFMYGDATAGATNVMAQGEQLQSMHAYALYAAEISDVAADMMGLRFVDTDVQRDSNYVYTIEMPLDSIDPTGQLYAARMEIINEYDGPAALEDVRLAEFEYALSVGLHRKNDRNYSFYFFERSEDNGATWTPLHNKPMKFEIDERMDSETEYYALTDSVDVLYKPYKYRVRGLSTFGEYSPWTEVSGMARDLTPPPAPIMNEPLHTAVDKAEITWIGEHCEQAEDFIGYMVNMGNFNDPEELDPISELLPPGSNKFEYLRDTFALDSNYFFQVTAVDTAGNQGVSFPYKMILVDSIPPAVPTNISGFIDSTGIVTLLWDQVKDKDLAGYRVYFANNPQAEFSQLTEENRIYNYFRDTIEVNSLSEEIYYRVVAVDARYNRSAFSEIAVVKRPDLIPPALPILTQPSASGGAVELQWRASSSTDVTGYLLYRRPAEGEDRTWTLLDSLGRDVLSYADNTAPYEELMEYTMRAVDDAENYSDYVTPMKGRRFFDEAISGISAVQAGYDSSSGNVQLTWSYQAPDIEFLEGVDYRYVVYRAEAGAAMQRYKQLVGKDPSYIDKGVKGETTYRYAMMIVYENGKKSGLSSEAQVAVPVKE